MRKDHLHAADELLLLHGSGELSASFSAQIRLHLEHCSQCRARLAELESTLAGFAEAHRESRDAELPPLAGARARLKAQLSELAAQDREQVERGHGVGANKFLHSTWITFAEHRRAAMLATVAIAACLLIAVRLHAPGERSYPPSTSVAHWDEPDLRLTPGATLPVTQNQVCGADASSTIAPIPASLQRKVFEEYGVTPSQPDAYEVDYLITPELGGATDIRNLWPQPYQNTVWNAHVKDQLEDRLHRMVCQGEVDLATAQRDISTDWIAAYRKYFHADRPVADNSSFNLPASKRTVPLT
jgi:hypothetical protein